MDWITAAKVVIFCEMCKFLCEKEYLSLRVRANGHTGCTGVTGRERKEYSAIAEMYNKEAKSTRLVGKIEEHFDTLPQ